MIYDTYEPFREVKGLEFSFLPSTYKVWHNQKIVSHGECKFIMGTIQCSEYNNKILFYVNMNRYARTDLLSDYIIDEFSLDIGVTSTDRILFLSLPQSTNVKNDKISMLSQIYSHTSRQKTFQEKEPYSCGVFAVDGQIAKVAFNVASPDYLVEFYS